MKYRTRTFYTDSQKALMWDRWQKGDSMIDIAKLFDRGHSSVQSVLTANGGIWPRERKPAPVQANCGAQLRRLSPHKCRLGGGRAALDSQ